MSAYSSLSLSMRRNEAQRRVAAQRVAIRDAWTDFERAEVRGEAKLLLVMTWMRRVFAVTALVASAMAMRRLFRKGGADRLIGALGLARGVRRLLNTVRSSPQN